jgi:hypothetical protein
MEGRGSKLWPFGSRSKLPNANEMHVETIERLRQTKLLNVEENEGGRRDYRGPRCGALIDYGEVNFQSPWD